MRISSENVMPMEQVLHGLHSEPAPAVIEKIHPDSIGEASAQRLQYLDLLAKLGIPLVMEGSPAEAFLVR